MEVSAGLASRVDTHGSNEDEEGLNEPAEVAEFLNELGEGDPRCPPLYLVPPPLALCQQQSLSAWLFMSLPL